MTIIRLKVENLRRQYYDAMGVVNELMAKYDIWTGDKIPEYRKAKRKEDRLRERLMAEIKGKRE